MGELDIEYLPISEFRERGYLHEVNRLLLHPLGLALEVKRVLTPGRVVTLTDESCAKLKELIDAGVEYDLLDDAGRAVLMDELDRAPRYEQGAELLGRVWDCRADPTGVVFGEDLLDPEKAAGVCTELLERRDERKKRTGGWVVQPCPDHRVLSTTYTDPELRSSGEGITEPGKFAGVDLPEDGA